MDSTPLSLMAGDLCAPTPDVRCASHCDRGMACLSGQEEDVALWYELFNHSLRLRKKTAGGETGVLIENCEWTALLA